MTAAFLQEMVESWAGEAVSFTNAGTEDRIRMIDSKKSLMGGLIRRSA
jgi:hypothetical protein